MAEEGEIIAKQPSRRDARRDAGRSQASNKITCPRVSLSPSFPSFLPNKITCPRVSSEFPHRDRETISIQCISRRLEWILSKIAS